MQARLARLLALVVLGSPLPAAAGNDDGVLLGNDAALTGGAVTAVISDGSALWYNPAGLAHARSLDTLDVNASAFVLRQYRMAGVLSASDGGSEDASTTEVVSIPSAVTFVRQLARMTAAFGLFTPQSNDYTLRSSLVTESAAVTRWQIALSEQQAQYHAGAGLGLPLGDRVMLGASLLGSYTTSAGSLQVAGGVETRDGTVLGFGTSSINQQATLLGLYANVGAMFRLTDRLRLGIALRTPGVAVFRSQRATSIDAQAVIDPEGQSAAGFVPADQREKEGDFSLQLPVRLRAGLALTLPHGGFVDLDGDFQSPLKNRALDIDRDWTWNLRLGTRWPIGEQYALGAGVFTDRGVERKLADGTGPIHFYGFSGGVQYWSARKLDASEKRERLTFSSTLAVRYAHGTGKFAGVRIDAETAEVRDIAVPVDVDELSLQIGSALYF